MFRSLAVISTVSVALLLPLWLLQTENLGVSPLVALWVDVIVVVALVFQSFCSGLIFNKLMEVALDEVEKKEKQIVSPILMFSYGFAFLFTISSFWRIYRELHFVFNKSIEIVLFFVLQFRRVAL